jgi:hypothetical protein
LESLGEGLWCRAEEVPSVLEAALHDNLRMAEELPWLI